MATIDNVDIINRIIEGRYEEDKPTRIVQYLNKWGKTTYGVTFKSDNILKYCYETEFVRNPVIVWDFVKDDYKEVGGL